MDATDPKMQKANKGSLLNDNSHTKIESPNKSAITFDDDENEDRKNNVHVDGNVDQEKQAKIFKDKINTLSKNSKVDENINEVIQNKINNGDIDENMLNQSNFLNQSHLSKVSNSKAVKIMNAENMNEYASNDRSIPNESFFNENLEDHVKMEQEIQKDKEQHNANIKVFEKNYTYKADGGKNKISGAFNVNNKELMTDFDKNAGDQHHLEVYKHEK